MLNVLAVSGYRRPGFAGEDSPAAMTPLPLLRRLLPVASVPKRERSTRWLTLRSVQPEHRHQKDRHLSACDR